MKIHISKPYITAMGSGLIRLCSDFVEPDNTTHTLFVEVEAVWSQYLVTDRADAWVFLAIPLAFREGWDIESEAPVTELFLHNLNEILLPTLAANDERCHFIRVYAEETREDIEGANAVGTGVSGGVDSTFTIKRYTSEEYKELSLTHLFVGSLSVDLWDYSEEDNLYSWEEKHKAYFDRYKIVSDYTGLPIIKQFSNVISYYTRIHKIRHNTVHTYITMAAVLCMKKLWNTYYFSSGYDFSEFQLNNHMDKDTSHIDLLLVYVLCDNTFHCFSWGGTMDRIEKTLELADYPLAQKMIHPCFTKQKNNCSKPGCSKCLRALLTLDYYCKLDCFSKTFDIKAYRENRLDYLEELVKRKDDDSFKRLFAMFNEKYPVDMKMATVNAQKKITEEQLNAVKTGYDSTLLLLKKKDPNKTIRDFFESKGIKRLYKVGNSRLGQFILENIGHIETNDYKTGSVDDCDAVFIFFLEEKKIQESKNKLRNVSVPIYTANDFINYCRYAE